MSKSLTWLGAVILIAGACRKSPNFDQLSSNFVVTTNIDTAASFSAYKTYFISDSMAYIGGKKDDTILYNDVSRQLVATVKQNMASRGYTFVDKSADPDLGFNAGVIRVTSTTIIYPGWWWDYPGWWDPWYWGWYYPYYYPWSVAYSVTTGTITLDMIDLKNASDHHQERVVWTAVLSGALGTDSAANLQRGVTAINQAFTQNPQIKAE